MLPLGNTCHGLSYIRVPTVTDKGIPVSSSYCIFSALREKHGFEFKRQEKLHPNTFPTFRAWRTHTKTKRHKLVLKRRKMALKQSKFMGTTRNTFFFSKQHVFFQTAKDIINYCSFEKQHFFCPPGWYRYRSAAPTETPGLVQPLQDSFKPFEARQTSHPFVYLMFGPVWTARLG